MEVLKAQNLAKAREAQISAAAAIDKTTITEGDITFSANTTTATGASSIKSGAPVKKKGPKAKLTAKEKKERSVRLLHYPRESSYSQPFIRSRLKRLLHAFH